MEHIHLLSSVDHRNRWTIYTTARWTNSRRLFSQASVLESRWISKKQRTLRSRIPQHHLKSHDINPMKSHEIPWNHTTKNPVKIPSKSHALVPPEPPPRGRSRRRSRGHGEKLRGSNGQGPRSGKSVVHPSKQRIEPWDVKGWKNGIFLRTWSVHRILMGFCGILCDLNEI